MDDQEKPRVVVIVDDAELIRGSLGGLMKEAGFPVGVSSSLIGVRDPRIQSLPYRLEAGLE